MHSTVDVTSKHKSAHHLLSTEVLLPHLVRPKQRLRHVFSAVYSFRPARRRHLGVAVAIAAETPWERRD